VTPNNTPSAEMFLQQQEVLPSEALFLDYAHYLLDLAGITQLPVRLDLVRAQLNLKRHAGPLSVNRGFLHDGKVIFINSDDPDTVQRFTEAHEIMETLVKALRPNIPSHQRMKFDQDKESWCERGAAELLMPSNLFFPIIQKEGISLKVARQMASLCQTSLTAAVRRMLDSDLAACIFAILQEGYKKHQLVPSQTGQESLWGKPSDWDPPAELRVWKHWKSPQVKNGLVRNESFSRESVAYRVFQAGSAGEVLVDQEYLDLARIKGTVHSEAMLIKINGAPAVMTLIHL